MRKEWLGLDRYRVDTFLSLIRRMVYEALHFCWRARGEAGGMPRAAVLEALRSALCEPPLGVQLHVVRVYVEELVR